MFSAQERLAPRLLLDQLAELEPPAPLVLVPRRQPRKLNAALDFLGEKALAQVHPDDARIAGIADGQPVVVRTDPGRAHRHRQGRPGHSSGCDLDTARALWGKCELLSNKDVIDPLTGMVRYSCTPVTLEPADS